MTKIHSIKIITASDQDWIHMLNSNNTSNYKGLDKLVVDFSETRFLEPRHFVSLACLIEDFHVKGATIEFKEGTYNINQYLKNIRFYEYWKSGFDRNSFTKLKIETALCLWKIKDTMINSYATEAQKYFQNSYFEGKNLESLHISLTEMFNNIFDHSGSTVDGYVLTQCYPKKDKIVTAICDFGVGIPKKINQIWEQNKRAKLTDEDALRAAFFRNISSKSVPQNKGFGLANLYDIVSKLNGKLVVFSNNAVLRLESDGLLKTYTSNKFFNGTLIVVTLYKRSLPDVEDEIENEEFLF